MNVEIRIENQENLEPLQDTQIKRKKIWIKK